MSKMDFYWPLHYSRFCLNMVSTVKVTTSIYQVKNPCRLNSYSSLFLFTVLRCTQCPRTVICQPFNLEILVWLVSTQFPSRRNSRQTSLSKWKSSLEQSASVCCGLLEKFYTLTFKKSACSLRAGLCLVLSMSKTFYFSNKNSISILC